MSQGAKYKLTVEEGKRLKLQLHPPIQKGLRAKPRMGTSQEMFSPTERMEEPGMVAHAYNPRDLRG